MNLNLNLNLNLNSELLSSGDGLHDKKKAFAIRVIKIIENSEYQARIVGGYVRDLLLTIYLSGILKILEIAFHFYPFAVFQLMSKYQSAHSKLEACDIDLATNASPSEIIEIFKHYEDIKIVPIGLEHGTIMLVSNGLEVEITTLRQDVSCDGRHATILFCDDWEEDSKRRDLTINALYLDIHGKIYDFHSGIEDLMKFRLRFIGDPLQRIQEDYLRMVRYCRFIGYFGTNNLDELTVSAICNASGFLSRISHERIANEMRKMLISDYCCYAVNIMIALNLLDYSLKPTQEYIFCFNLSEYLRIMQNSSKAALSHTERLLAINFLLLRQERSFYNGLRKNILKYMSKIQQIIDSNALSNFRDISLKEIKQIYLQFYHYDPTILCDYLIFRFCEESVLKLNSKEILNIEMLRGAMLCIQELDATVDQMPITPKILIEYGFDPKRITALMMRCRSAWLEQEVKGSSDDMLAFLQNQAIHDANA